MNLCEDGSFLSVIRIILTLYKFVQVLLPLILIFMTSLDFYNAIVKGTPDDLKKCWNVAVKRLIASLIVVFVPTIITFSLKIVKGDTDYSTCITSATSEGIESAYIKAAETAIDKFKSTISTSDLAAAKKTIRSIKDEDIREAYLSDLEKYAAEHTTARTTKMTVPSVSYTAGVNTKSYSASTGKTMNYLEIIPEKAKSKMPLIVYLHGDGEIGNVDSLKRLPIYNYITSEYDNEIPFITIMPSTTIASWTTNGIPETLKELIDSVVEEYKIDKDHIIITGASRGAIGTWFMVAKYGSFFSAALPVSCCAENRNGSAYVSVPIYAMSGNSGDAEYYYSTCMTSLVNDINSKGGNAKMDIKRGQTHSTISSYYKDKSLFMWMLTQ